MGNNDREIQFVDQIEIVKYLKTKQPKPSRTEKGFNKNLQMIILFEFNIVICLPLHS